MVYNNDVVVFGTPLIALRVGDAPYYERRAVYSSGSGTSTLVFEYIVEVGIRAMNGHDRRTMEGKMPENLRLGILLFYPRLPRRVQRTTRTIQKLFLALQNKILVFSRGMVSCSISKA